LSLFDYAFSATVFPEFFARPTTAMLFAPEKTTMSMGFFVSSRLGVAAIFALETLWSMLTASHGEEMTHYGCLLLQSQIEQLLHHSLL